MEIHAGQEYSEDEGVVVNLRGRDNKPVMDGDKPLTIKVAGRYSKRYRQAVKRQQERNLKKRSFDIDADYLESAPKELEAACIIEWPFTANGEPWPITPKNYDALLKACPWYQEQIREGIDSYADFFGES